jgi:hypothetical protein
MHLTVSHNCTTLINSRPHKSSNKIKHTTWARILLQTEKNCVLSPRGGLANRNKLSVCAPNHALTKRNKYSVGLTAHAPNKNSIFVSAHALTKWNKYSIRSSAHVLAYNKYYFLYACTDALKTNKHFLCCSTHALTRRYKHLTKYFVYLLANKNDSVWISAHALKGKIYLTGRIKFSFMQTYRASYIVR